MPLPLAECRVKAAQYQPQSCRASWTRSGSLLAAAQCRQWFGMLRKGHPRRHNIGMSWKTSSLLPAHPSVLSALSSSWPPFCHVAACSAAHLFERSLRCLPWGTHPVPDACCLLDCLSSDLDLDASDTAARPVVQCSIRTTYRNVCGIIISEQLCPHCLLF